MHTRARNGILVSLTPFLVLLAAQSGMADSQSDSPNLNPDLTALENKFFEHAYPTDPVATRVERLEKMVFGEAKTGSDQSRIAALLVAVPDALTPAASTIAAAPSQSNPDPNANKNIIPANPDDQQIADSSDYPRITQLEQEMLGKTFVKEPIGERLEQLERKAFGAPSTTEDLSDRTDALEKYAHRHFPNTVQTAYSEPDPDQNPTYGTYGRSNPQPAANFLHGHNAGDLPPSATIESQVSWLETRVLGTNYAADSLVARVRRLQSQVFPGASYGQESLAEQVHSLIGAVELAPAPAQTEVAQNPVQNPAPFSAPIYNSNPYSPGYNPAPGAPTSFGAQPTNYGAPSNYGSPTGYGAPAQSFPQNYGSNTDPSQYQNSQYQQQPTASSAQSTHKSSSLFHGLARALGTVGSLALRSGMGMGGYGMPGVGGMY